jgi:hypothetical protein
MKDYLKIAILLAKLTGVTLAIFGNYREAVSILILADLIQGFFIKE